MRKLFILLMVFFLPFVNADIISINSGGSGNVVLNSDEYIEGFFSCVPFTCSDLGYDCDIWDDGCGRTMDCGTCASGYTCSSGVCTAVPVTPPSGGGGGGGGVITPTCDIVTSPSEINLRLAINRTVTQIIKVTNTGAASVSITPTQLQNKDKYYIIFEPSSFLIKPGETIELKMIFVALGETGIFTERIKIGCAGVLSSLNIKTVSLLFDSNIIVLNKDYKVPRGDELLTEVTLLPVGDPERLDVTLNYVIKDYAGKTYLTRSETTMVEDKKVFERNFDTGTLPLGSYIIGLQLVYPDGTAPSSAYFEVVARAPITLRNITFFLIILILIIAILLILILINRQRKKRKQAEVPGI